MLVLAVAEVFASRLFRSIVIVSLSNHLLSSLVSWCSAFCHTTAACVSGEVHYAIPVPLLFVARCTHQAVRQGHQQPIGGAKSGWRRNARALRDDGKTKQNALQKSLVWLVVPVLSPKVLVRPSPSRRCHIIILLQIVTDFSDLFNLLLSLCSVDCCFIRSCFD